MVSELLDDRPRLQAMAEAARRIAVPGAAGAIARHLAELAGEWIPEAA
jgi:UDP-N-acetylglucosamine:LPS N-acetylglucosamine transferase